jgi:hypothetical protein
MEEAELRLLAKQLLEAGKLPKCPQVRTWGGHGEGLPCSLCNEPITQSDIEYELQFHPDPALPRMESRRFHPRCLAAWEFERDHS